MTQEELDALMSGGMDMDDESSEDTQVEEAIEDENHLEETPEENSENLHEENLDPITASVEAAELPFPATDENKMVHQLDDVTKESEEKATEIFDIIENISNDLMDSEETVNDVIKALNANRDLFETLSTKFPDIETFKTQYKINEDALEKANNVVETLQNSGDAIMNVMDIMQYQDIHRQKIERVVNVMRSLSRYMSTLFEGKIDDEKRVASATHIVGDTHNDVASDDDIEALLEQFGK